ncbi:MAG: hypothetical protein JXB24_00415 [Bacteroidales bacterium]|nr:hypothetical protein [Bacteroidales bacterium]
MYRVIVLIINLIAALSIGSIFQSNVVLNIEVPNEVVAGTEFDVQVKIQKGNLESFSRLQHTFPAGLTATSYISSNADFTFDEKRVRFIWLRLPSDNEVTVTYKIKVDERLKGTFDIQGKFSYIDENERKSVSIESQPITIIPSPNIDPALIVDINDFEKQVVPYIPPATSEPQMACIRQKPYPDKTGDGYIVNILVNKESKQKFAKIEESIPSAYKAVNIDPKEAIFTFREKTAKFLWMNLPADPYFMVSYKLIPVLQASAPPQLNGKFSYLEGEKTMSIDIKETDMELASLTPGEINSLILSLSSPALAQTTEQTRVVETLSQEKPVSETRKVRPKEPETNMSYMLEPENGVYYRVQLAAGHKAVDIEKYFRKYNLDKEVRKEYHEGWQKYSVGSFGVYKDARDYRIHIWNTTIINDAFVSAYNDGKRITVQEALMIADQRWYK